MSGALRVTVVAVRPVMTAPVGIFVPLTGEPRTKPAVVETLSVFCPIVPPVMSTVLGAAEPT